MNYTLLLHRTNGRWKGTVWQSTVFRAQENEIIEDHTITMAMADDDHYLDSYLSDTLPALGLDVEAYAPYVKSFVSLGLFLMNTISSDAQLSWFVLMSTTDERKQRWRRRHVGWIDWPATCVLRKPRRWWIFVEKFQRRNCTAAAGLFKRWRFTQGSFIAINDAPCFWTVPLLYLQAVLSIHITRRCKL